MNADRLSRALGAMREAGLDALFIANLKNARWLSGVRPTMPEAVQPFGDPEGFLLVQAGRCDVLVDGRYIAAASRQRGVIAHRLETPVSAAVIAAKIRELLPPGGGTVGFEQESVLHGDAVRLFESAADIRWRPADDILLGLRQIKAPAERDLLRRAQQLTAEAFEHVCGVLRPGMSEAEVALEIENYLRAHGEGSAFAPIVAFGETSANPHYRPSPHRRLERGQLILMDFGGIHEGYCGDLTRMAVAGRADARMREVYDLVLEAQRRCLAGVRPGADGHDLDALCRDTFASRGWADRFMHGSGHGLGLAIHEGPRVRKDVHQRIEAGMCFTVEPGLYFDGWGGVRIEDVVFVTEDGCENLTPAPKELRELPLERLTSALPRRPAGQTARRTAARARRASSRARPSRRSPKRPR